MHLRPLLRKGLQLFYRHRAASTLGFLFFAVSLSLIGGAEVAYAQDGESAAIVINLILTTLTTIINMVVWGIGKIILAIIQVIIIPILNYNSFSTSPIIGLGWSLVRDVMNMFVIVALIFVAIFTIVGNHRAHWEQQLPQLFIAVVLMNFSRTICGILIDISQVIMFTFVNALLDIAAGNFTQLFQLEDFGKINMATASAQIESGQGFTPALQFTEAFLQIPLYGSIAAILFLLALAFLYRIVLLWILVIMSPMAFFLGGIKGIFHGAEHSAGNWWGKFTGALMMGPILTFFLWLSLAAASSGSIATSEGFTPAPAEGDTFFSIAALDSSHITSLLLALILLTVGMQVAGEQSSKVGGAAASLINEGMGKRVVGGAITLPFRAGRAAGGYAARAVSPYTGEAAARANLALGPAFGAKSLTEGIGKAGTGLASAVGAVGIPGAGLVAAGISRKAGEWENAGHHLRDEREQAADKAFKAKGHSQKMVDMDLAESKNFTGMSSEAQEAAAKGYMDPQVRKDRIDHLMKTKNLSKDAATKQVNDKLAGVLTGQLDKVDKLPEAEQSKVYADASKHIEKIWNSGSKGQELVQKKLLDDGKLVQDKLRNNADAFKTPGLSDKLMNYTTSEMRKDKEGNLVAVKLGDKAKVGGLGQDVRKIVKPDVPSAVPRPGIKVTQFAPEEVRENVYRDALSSQDPAKNLTKALGSNEGESIVERVQASDLSSPQARDIGSAIIESGVDISSAPARQNIAQAIVTQQGAKNIGKALRQGQLKPSDITEDNLMPANPSQVDVVRSIIVEQPDVSTMPEPARKEFGRALHGLSIQGKISASEKTAGQQVLLNSGESLQGVLPTSSVNVDADEKVTFAEEANKDLTRLVKANPANIRHLDSLPMKVSDDSTRFVVRSTSKQSLRDLASKAEGATGKDLEDIRTAVRVSRKAVDVEKAGGPGPADAAARQKAQDLDVEISRIEKLLS